MRKIILAAFLLLAAALPVGLGAVEAGLPDFLTEPGERTGRKCVMFIFGHFDDDSVIAGTINMYVRAGWEVHMVWVTSAGMGEGTLWGETVLRRREMEKAMEIQGIPPANCHVLGFPDRQAVHHLPEIVDLVTALVRQYRPSVIITCAYEGGHWDHDASCLAGYVASRRVDFESARFEIPTYNASGPKIMPFRVNGFIKAWGPTLWVMPDEDGWKVRRQVRYAYKSQWFFMVPQGMLFAWRHLQGRGEPIRATPDYDFTSPPHPGVLLIQHPVVGALRNAPFSWWEEGVRQIPEFHGEVKDWGTE